MTDINFKVDGNWTNAALAIYKVGAIYMSVDSTSPATLFGGTWVALEGRMLIGADSTYSAGTTGGSKTTTLATDNLPAHAHTVPAHSHGLNSHTHTTAIGSHTHSVTTTAKNNASNPLYLSDTTLSWGKGMHYGYDGTALDGLQAAGGRAIGIKIPALSGTAASTDIGSKTSGGPSTTNTANSAAFNTQNTGSGSAFDTISPYLAVYMWKRTA